MRFYDESQQSSDSLCPLVGYPRGSCGVKVSLNEGVGGLVAVLENVDFSGLKLISLNEGVLDSSCTPHPMQSSGNV